MLIPADLLALCTLARPCQILALSMNFGRRQLSNLLCFAVPGRLGLLASLCRDVEVPLAAKVLHRDHEGMDVVEALAGAGHALSKNGSL